MTVALRIDDRIINRVDQIAESQGINRSTYIRQAIISKLEDDMDIAAAEEALEDVKKHGTIPWEKVREHYGLEPRTVKKRKKTA